ncbi:hypothetical protein SCLCIDRAFT_114211, partial [Scleroderma citrinum Foug A]
WQEPAIQALQALNSERQRVNVTPIPGTLVVHIPGSPPYLTSFVAVDVFRSPVHRSIKRSGMQLHSIVVFFNTNSDVQVEVRHLGSPHSIT